jgi:hypothetical protein
MKKFEDLNIIENSGFVISDIYDVLNIKGIIDSFKLNNIVPKYLYEGVDFELEQPGGIIIFSTDLNKYELPGYTVGKKFKGSYTGKNGIQFNETSYTIDISGIDSTGLKLIATEICREFKQETVMVRDFNNNATKVYFINQL